MAKLKNRQQQQRNFEQEEPSDADHATSPPEANGAQQQEDEQVQEAPEKTHCPICSTEKKKVPATITRTRGREMYFKCDRCKHTGVRVKNEP